MIAWDISKRQELYKGLTEERRCWLSADAAFYIAILIEKPIGMWYNLNNKQIDKQEFYSASARRLY